MSVEETARNISSMRVRGALDIALAAAKALLKEVSEGKSMRELEESATLLKNARPTAVSLPNSVEYVMYCVKDSAGKDEAETRIKEFISLQEQAMEKIGRYGSHLIQDGDILLTICNSDTVINVFRHAREDGKKFSVYACETRPRNQGILTVKALQEVNVDATLIVDSAAHYVMREKKVSGVYVGADTVYANGDVVNKIGTSQIALTANANGIDFNVATQTIKFSPQSIYGYESKIEERDPGEVSDMKDVKIFNPAFDVTSKEHVTRLITEEGVIPPEAVYSLLKEKFTWRMSDDDE